MIWHRRLRQWAKKREKTPTLKFVQTKPRHRCNNSSRACQLPHLRGKFTRQAPWQISMPRKLPPLSTHRAVLPCSRRWWLALREISTRSDLPTFRALGSLDREPSWVICQAVCHRLRRVCHPTASWGLSFIQIWSRGLLRIHVMEIYLPKLLLIISQTFYRQYIFGTSQRLWGSIWRGIWSKQTRQGSGGWVRSIFLDVPIAGDWPFWSSVACLVATEMILASEDFDF